jgi:hypothetical protein
MLAAEAPINAKSRVEARIDTESRVEALPSRKVDLWFDLKLFHFSFGHADFFVCSFMDSHPQATVVLFPCSLLQGFKEATMGITLFHLPSAKVQIDYRLRYAHTRTRAAQSKLPVDPCATRSL